MKPIPVHIALARAALSPRSAAVSRSLARALPPDEWTSPAVSARLLPADLRICIPSSDVRGSANGEARRRSASANRRSVRPKGAGFARQKRGSTSRAALPFFARAGKEIELAEQPVPQILTKKENHLCRNVDEPTHMRPTQIILGGFFVCGFIQNLRFSTASRQ